LNFFFSNSAQFRVPKTKLFAQFHRIYSLKNIIFTNKSLKLKCLSKQKTLKEQWFYPNNPAIANWKSIREPIQNFGSFSLGFSKKHLKII